MIIIPKRQIWTRQPQYPVSIDGSHPLGKQQWAMVHVPGIALFGSANPVVTARNNTIIRPGASGTSLVYTATTTDGGFTYGDNTGLLLSKLSGVCLFLSYDAEKPLVLWNTSWQGASGGGFIISMKIGGFIDIDKHNVIGLIRANNAAISYIPNCVAWSYNGSTGRIRIALNGVLTSGTSSITFSHSIASTLSYMQSYPGDAGPGEISFLAISPDECFDDTALIDASLNPWAIFKRRSSHVFVVASGGGADVTLDPTTGSLTVTGQTPTITLPVSVTATTGSIVFTGNQPTLTNPVALSPTTGAATISGETSSITLPVALTSTTGSITFTGNQPTIEVGGGVTLDPTTGSVLFSGNAPTITLPVALTATTGSITFTGNQPTIDAPGAVTLTPTTGTISLSGNTTTITLPVSLTPDAGSIVFTGNQPTVNTGADVIITPTAGSIVFSGQTPSFILPVALTPTTGAVAFFGNVPSITLPVSLAPSAGQLVTIGNAPTITIGATATAILDLRYSARAVRRDYTAIYGQGSRNE